MAFVSNIKVGDTTNGVRAVAIPSGQVNSTSTSTAFTATVPGITELKNGVCVFLKNGVVTSASGCTLNINGLGAKPIYNTMAASTAVTTTFNSGYTMLFVYDETRVSGGCWMMYYGYNSGYSNNVSQGQCYGTCSTAVGTAAKTVTMSSYALVAHGICAIKFTNGNTAANPTLNINSKGAKAIYWNGAACPTNLIKANDVVIMIYNTQYHIVGIYNGNRGFATTTPIMNGTGAIGTSTEYARADHVHPTDTSRASVASPAFTGTPTAPTPTAGNSSTIVANTGWVQGEIADALSDISGAMHFKGRALQTLTDGGTENAASSSGSPYTGEAGDVYLQSGTDTNEEYVWVKLGDAAGYWEKLGGDSYATLAEVQDAITTAIDNSTSNIIFGTTTEGASTINLTNCTNLQLYVRLRNAANLYLIIQVYDMENELVDYFELRPYGMSSNNIYFYGLWGTVLVRYSCDASNTSQGLLTQTSYINLNNLPSHTHGNISYTGAVTTTVTVASSDRILITDNSDNSKIKGGPAFNTASTTYFLNAAGNWTVPVGDHKVTQAAAITTNGNYPILLGNTTATTAVTATVNKASTLVYNPSTKKLLVNSATVATVADIPTWTVS